MTEAETTAFKNVKTALDIASPGASDKVTMDSHLVDDGVLDSLDLMTFMFELEDVHGSKLEQVTETFDDYRVKTIVGFMVAA
ncbi:hypothetical protein [Actibacterium sp. 188UL27-1]|uniref:hypothetical protein n=1 Tax=Actibacterium sp. 188UL27-1 TaxID=2786961 RepID=UPI00195AF93B|nr:hypothetical protein [Actibacterium sp. 188UL27-1]MBM7069031.1 hypothetical protein [Actibacterium sp. 188UL27-1]